MGGGRIGAGPGAPALLARGISKSYGGTRALDDAGVEVRQGEVHALLGRNGSGKSTLVRILAGRERPAPGGEVRAGGRVGAVHQDLGLIPALTVLDNLRLTALASRRGAHIRWADERRRARAALARAGGAGLDLRAAVAALSPAERARLAIARALDDLGSAGGGALVLDEATAVLPEAEARDVLRLARAAAERGAGVLVVTHSLREALALCDRATVLRDGRVAAVVDVAATSEEHLAELVLGGPPPPARPPAPPAAGAVAAQVRGLAAGRLAPLDLSLRAGEVVGLTGPAGGGWQEVPGLLAGARRAAAGTLVLGGERHELAAMTPGRAVAAGIAPIPADRLGEGLAGALPAGDNVALPRLGALVRGLRLDRRRLAAEARAALEAFGVRPADPAVRVAALSGGNQQRALLAKWLEGEPRLVVALEPLQGIDAAGRPAAVARLRGAAAAGAAVLCAAGDDDLLRSFCDRVVRIGDGG